MERNVKSIDIHAHLTPQCFIRAMNAGEVWHGVNPGDMRVSPRGVWTPEQRINDMNSLGVDVHVVSTGAALMPVPPISTPRISMRYSPYLPRSVSP